MKHPIHTAGYIGLLTVLIITTVLLFLSLSVGLGGLRISTISLSQSSSLNAKLAAEGCIEHALYELKLDDTYAGNEGLTVGSATCQLETIGGSGNENRTIQATGTNGSSIKRIEVIVSQVNPETTISSWTEVTSF